MPKFKCRRKDEIQNPNNKPILSLPFVIRASSFLRHLVFVIRIFPLQYSNVDEVSRDGGCGGHRRRNKVRAAALALTPLEIPIARGGTTLAGCQDVGIHGQTHAAARLAPFEAALAEYLVEPFGLGLSLDPSAAGHDEAANALGDATSANHRGRSPQVLDSPVRA